ncbi:MAG: helicase-associated domain-containing protein [Chloroflexi bacterium]|nr:helicase-associated domain-containing protein [Chloroflexota bacterium]
MKSLREALLEQPPALLRGIASLNGIVLPEGGARDQWATSLAEELANPEVIERAWRSLSEVERAALSRVIANGGRIKAFQMLRDYGEIRPFGPVALSRDKPWLSPVNITEKLWYLGLIHHAYDMLGESRGEIYFVPDVIMQYLPKAEAGDFAVRHAPTPDAAQDDDDALMWDLFILMAWVVREEPPLDTHTDLNPADLYRLHAQLTVPDSIGESGVAAAPRLSFLLRIARSARLIKRVTATGLRLGPDAKTWLRLKREKRRLALVEAWRRERSWNELHYVPSLKVQETGWRNDPGLARTTALDYLARCPRGAWLSLPSFVSEVKRLAPDFQRPDGDYDRWHIRDARTDKLLLGFAQWDHIEGAQLTFLFEGPLRWLGIVRLGGKPGEARAFQLTPFGECVLGLNPAELPEPKEQSFVVQGDFEVLVPRDASFYARFQLERAAERVQWDRTSTYRLTRDSITRLLRRNATIDQVLAFLKRVARPPFPRNVEYTLREWATKYGEITLRRAAILHTRNRNLLTELQQHPELSAYIIEVISPTVALVVPERLDELHKRLQALHYSPRIEENDSQH